MWKAAVGVRPIFGAGEWLTVAKPKILLVDDTRLVLELEKSFLKLSDLEVQTAMNGVEALELIRMDPPDLIFMDMNMPDMDGVACCTILKGDPFLCSIPLVMLTTAGREGDRERAMRAGCDDFLTKPVERREFLEKARKYTDAVERRDVRIPCHSPVIFLLGKSPIGAEVMDTGEGGVFIATHEPVRQESRIKLALYLPEVNPFLMEVTGRVAWLNQEGKRVNPTLPPGFGMEFLDLGERERAALKLFVDAGSVSRPGHGAN
jgi:two-component system cell cycle response regulator